MLVCQSTRVTRRESNRRDKARIANKRVRYGANPWNKPTMAEKWWCTDGHTGPTDGRVWKSVAAVVCCCSLLLYKRKRKEDVWHKMWFVCQMSRVIKRTVKLQRAVKIFFRRPGQCFFCFSDILGLWQRKERRAKARVFIGRRCFSIMTAKPRKQERSGKVKIKLFELQSLFYFEASGISIDKKMNKTDGDVRSSDLNMNSINFFLITLNNVS